eukprot:16441673-Heterocapsa_arctica.AAC.2
MGGHVAEREQASAGREKGEKARREEPTSAGIVQMTDDPAEQKSSRRGAGSRAAVQAQLNASRMLQGCLVCSAESVPGGQPEIKMGGTGRGRQKKAGQAPERRERERRRQYRPSSDRPRVKVKLAAGRGRGPPSPAPVRATGACAEPGRGERGWSRPKPDTSPCKEERARLTGQGIRGAQLPQGEQGGSPMSSSSPGA